MALKAVIFDYGDTLISTRMNWSRVLLENLSGLVQALAAELPRVDYDRLKRDFMFMRAMARKRAEQEYRETSATSSLAAALAVQGFPAIEQQLLQQGVDGYFRPEEQNYSIIMGVPETLTKLQAMDLRLGLVSNATCSNLILRALKSRGLHNFFEHLLVSADCGICKPDPVIFHSAAAALGVEADECAVVGDRLDTDIAGANKAGMRSVLVDFLGDETEAEDGGPMPDVVVRHPEALVGIFNTWIRQG